MPRNLGLEGEIPLGYGGTGQLLRIFAIPIGDRILSAKKSCTETPRLRAAASSSRNRESGISILFTLVFSPAKMFASGLEAQFEGGSGTFLRMKVRAVSSPSKDLGVVLEPG